jgi:maltose alpha-D-glucosyltransferase / alpha-amylase
MLKSGIFPEENSLWYKDVVIYELHVRAFYDSDGDGIGDFRGLTEKLDYLHDLGITALWLLPFYPSPLKDDGYDIADYTSIHPSYGTMNDFSTFLREAHRRGIRVITELVLNHTSDQHAWFQRARRSPPGSRWRDFYVWSDTPEKFKDARIIFKDFEISNWTWDNVAKSYYWHRFYSHQPDLNYDNPAVRRAMLKVMDYWFELGVDGLRLDAVPYLYEREGTNCENLPETHGFLKELRRHVDEKFRDRMLLGEANQWPEDASAYFGNGDECHMAFHFPLMPRLFMAIRMEDRFPIVEIMQQTPPIPEPCQWALFLRNHDELTLEMVTDEERDYMYRVYANDNQARVNLGIRRRLAPLLSHNRRKTELMKALLFSLPGTPVLYYGDEIGMGDNIYLGDRNGVRTPFQWSPDRNAGFSRATPQKLYLPVIIDPEYHYEAYNVEAQQNNPSSMLWFMKRLIAFRKRYLAASRGGIQLLYPANHKVLAFIRSCGDERLLFMANLSRFAQPVELDLSEFRGMVPIEGFGQTRFPAITADPYLLTLGPHSFLFFDLDEQSETVVALKEQREVSLPTVNVESDWEDLFLNKDRKQLSEVLFPYIQACRWFGGKARTLQRAFIQDLIPYPYRSARVYICLAQMEYTQGEPEIYIVNVGFASGAKAQHILSNSYQAAIARVNIRGKRQDSEGLIYDALWDRDFTISLLQSLLNRRRFKSGQVDIIAAPTLALRKMLDSTEPVPEPLVLKSEQSNTSVVFGDKLIAKFFRRLERGINPDLEMSQYLERQHFGSVPRLAGAIEYRTPHDEPATMVIVHEFIRNEGDAWQYTLDFLKRFYEAALAIRMEDSGAAIVRRSLLSIAQGNLPAKAVETIGPYLESARLLARRTAEMHRALAMPTDDPAIGSEPLNDLNRRAMYHALAGQVDQKIEILRGRLGALPEDAKSLASQVIEKRDDLARFARSILDRKIEAMRIRCHGDFHLGQVLYTGKDFVIIDFEGEPARLLGQRRIKYTSLRDVAGMLRSFHYAAYAPMYGQTGSVRPEDIERLQPWARFWYICVGAAYLKMYLDLMADLPLLPKSLDQMQVLLNVSMLDKAVYELGYELNNRPNWVKIPLEGILQLIESSPEADEQ